MPGLGGTSAVTARESQVVGQFTRLNSETKALHETIAVLEERLAPVLRGVKPEATGDKLQPKEALVHHAEQMSNFADAVENAHRKIAEILNRLEL